MTTSLAGRGRPYSSSDPALRPSQAYSRVSRLATLSSANATRTITRPDALDAQATCQAAGPVASRKASTAIIRRFTSRSSARPSFWKIEPMCFSTARSLM